MKTLPLSLALLLTLSCTSPTPPPPPRATPNRADPATLQSLHVRLTIRPADGSVQYLGYYDGRRNLLGQHGITAALVGVEPPDFPAPPGPRLARVADDELLFEGVDQTQIAWQKRYRLTGSTVHVTYRVTNGRDQAFDAIVYSLSDMPDATITGDNRDQLIDTPAITAHFHATIDDPNFPGEQMNPFAMRSDPRKLAPGDSMEFNMTWELTPKRRQ